MRSVIYDEKTALKIIDGFSLAYCADRELIHNLIMQVTEWASKHDDKQEIAKTGYNLFCAVCRLDDAAFELLEQMAELFEIPVEF